MAFTYLENTSLEEARRLFLESVSFGIHEETVSLPDAAGRITAKPVYANISAPHYLASAMDGIAVRASDTFSANESHLLTLNAGRYVEVDTGDRVPDGMDAVIMIEDVILLDEGDIQLSSPASPWQHIRQIGEDICAGEMIATGSTRVTPAMVGAMLAGGVTEVAVQRKPKVAIIPTGDEIVAPTNNPQPGEIIEFNSSIFSAMLKDWGASPIVYPIVADNEELIVRAVEAAAQECDIVLLNAGSSAGREDLSSNVLKRLGEQILHGISIKPGKPTILGTIQHKPFVGVPGYPVSGLVVLEQIVHPLVEKYFSHNDEPWRMARAKLTRRLMSSVKYEEFVRVKLGLVRGSLVATPLNRGAGVVSSFVKADGILRVPQDVEGLNEGTEIEIELRRPLQDIEKTIVAIGSHDPMLDEISDMLIQTGSFMSSTHVGSMGGIMAIKRGEAHLAGIHLLDETDGNYNVSYLNKYFPERDVMLIRGVQRLQGLMVQLGNPKNISGIQDLCKEGISYVNRQKGAGTRILLDYLLAKEKINTEKLYGYDREEFTHMSVAAQIQSGGADCGMGIYSAANAFGLDFIPICDEQYDFLIDVEFYHSVAYQKFHNVITSDAFAKRLTDLGGYKTQGIGVQVPLFGAHPNH